MMLFLIAISIIIAIVMAIKDDECIIFPIGAFVIKLGIVCWLLAKIVEGRTIEDKIELYQTQNKEIEEKVEIAVKQYMQFENNTYTELKTDSYITLVTLYPDLKSDTLISEEITLYEKNNRKITKLKEQKINIRTYKWWLYFGGKNG